MGGVEVKEEDAEEEGRGGLRVEEEEERGGLMEAKGALIVPVAVMETFSERKVELTG